jgi:hypothetical protein
LQNWVLINLALLCPLHSLYVQDHGSIYLSCIGISQNHATDPGLEIHQESKGNYRSLSSTLPRLSPKSPSWLILTYSGPHPGQHPRIFPLTPSPPLATTSWSLLHSAWVCPAGNPLHPCPVWNSSCYICTLAGATHWPPCFRSQQSPAQ